MTSQDSHTPNWIRGDGPDADVVLSTRARLARSLAGFSFPSRASGEELSTVARQVRSACTALAERFPGLTALDIGKLDWEQKAFLLDAHVASVEQLRGGDGRIVILEPSAVLSIMVNEEDHLRIQSLMSGFVPEAAWELVDSTDDVLSTTLKYGYSRRYGYLTSNVSNVGTGLRVSAMMHLAGMALKGKLNAQLRAAYDLGVSIRGMFGEGTRPIGDLFQVSNELTLGISEIEIVERVRSVAQYLLGEEWLARKELLDRERTRLIDRAARSLRALQGVRSVAAGQAITLMSPIRLAAELDLVRECPRALLNELLMGMRVSAAEEIGVGMERAELLRKKLAGVHIIPG